MVIPLSLARPFLFVVSCTMHIVLRCDQLSSSQVGSVFYVPVQGGLLYGCMRVYTLPDEMMSKYVSCSVDPHYSDPPSGIRCRRVLC